MSKKYLIWTSENGGDRFDADLVVSLLDEVQFFQGGKKVKVYDRKSFLRYNPKWVEKENKP